MKYQPRPGIRWRAVLVTGGLLGGGAGIALSVPIAHHAIEEYREAEAAKPRPVPAPPDDFRNIVLALIHEYGFFGAPPPPPADGDVAAPRPPRQVVLVESSVSFCPPAGAASEVARPCNGLARADWVTAVDLNTEIPLKLRQELVAANTVPHALPRVRTPQAILASNEQIRMLFSAPSSWDGFYSRYPATAGLLKVSRPVLSSDGSRALLYAEHICGSLCGSGALYLLQRDGASWKIEKTVGMWIS